MNTLRLALLIILLLALCFTEQGADAGPCGPGGGMMGGPPPAVMGPPPGTSGGVCGPGGGSGPGPGALNFGMCGPPASGAAQMTSRVINLLDNYLKNQPNLRAGNLTVKGNFWEAEILDRQGNIVNRLLIDPRTGYFYYQK